MHAEILLRGFFKKIWRRHSLICLGIFVAGSLVSSCSTVNAMAQAATSSLKDDWHQTSDKNNLARVESSVRWQCMNEAWKFANKLHSPESRAEAFRLIALCEKNSQGKIEPKEEALSKLKAAIDELKDPMKALFYELSLVEATYVLNPDKAREMLKTCEEKIWKIASAQERAPFLIQIASFELKTTKDLDAGKKAIAVAKETIQMIADASHRKSQEYELACLIESHSNALCAEK
ncbi:MAG: hypothetical protein KDK63_04860 [Chlamydiia bacterium]|nr:hypothetical protein [Chlamydiia bacterium]